MLLCFALINEQLGSASLTLHYLIHNKQKAWTIIISECSSLDNKEFLKHVNNKTLRWVCENCSMYRCGANALK